ncbi:MAG: glycosyltransferase family 1 protein [Pseudomonadota bacterium]
MASASPSVILNATALLSPLSGIGRYVHELAVALRGLHVPLHYYSAGRWSEAMPLIQSERVTATRRLIAGVPGARWWARHAQNRLFSRGAASLHGCVYHEPNYLTYDFDGPVAVTAHDASWVRFPAAHPAERVRMMDRYFPRSLAQARRVIVDSDFVAGEMRDIFGLTRDKLRTVHLGVSPRFKPMSAHDTFGTCQRFGLTHGQYILAVGTLEPRKNLATLLSAWRLIPEALSRKFPLVVAGQTGWRHTDTDQQMTTMARSGQLRLLGHVDDADLPALYAASCIFVYPSLYEGFGLPPLEAMASGVPVIASDRASIPEVVGQAGVLVDPLDTDLLASTLNRLLQDSEERTRLATLGLAQSSHFSWAACALKTLAVYKEIQSC